MKSKRPTTSQTTSAKSLMRLLAVATLALSVITTSIVGCGGEGGRLEFISLGTAPPGGAFQPMGNAIAETLNVNKPAGVNWKVQSKGTNGSQDNIRQLKDGDLQLALSNAAITYFAVHGGGDWKQTFEMQTVATLAPNVAMFITPADSGIKTIKDLQGKRVVIGPSGAGFDMFVRPILEGHGVSYDDFTKLNAIQNSAVDMLADGQADAAFLGGAVPTASIQRACQEMSVHFIPFEADVVKKLSEDYPFFWELTVTKDKYSALEADFKAMNVGSMHLITSADADEETIYQLTKTLWENRSDVSHPAAKFINEQNAARDTGTPFHPGAIRFYKEAGIWPEEASEATEGDETEDTADDESESTDTE